MKTKLLIFASKQQPYVPTLGKNELHKSSRLLNSSVSPLTNALKMQHPTRNPLLLANFFRMKAGFLNHYQNYVRGLPESQGSWYFPEDQDLQSMHEKSLGELHLVSLVKWKIT